ncbi:MAG: hypothetical protein ACYTJ0_01765 [Planctomycetota bacterium]
MGERADNRRLACGCLIVVVGVLAILAWLGYRSRSDRPTSANEVLDRMPDDAMPPLKER